VDQRAAAFNILSPLNSVEESLFYKQVAGSSILSAGIAVVIGNMDSLPNS
jgi:hypothetical protein